MDIRKIPGTALVNSDNQVVYTLPVGEHVIRDLLGNWENFMHAEDDIDPWVKMAVVHSLFGVIHPFADGNGRTGRILHILFLLEKDVLNLPILYLSRHSVAHKAE